jgi:hypothetical protein
MPDRQLSALPPKADIRQGNLFILGALSFGAASLGRTILRYRWSQWPRLHLALISASYILMITATSITEKTCRCGESFRKLLSGFSPHWSVRQ